MIDCTDSLCADTIDDLSKIPFYPFKACYPTIGHVLVRNASGQAFYRSSARGAVWLIYVGRLSWVWANRCSCVHGKVPLSAVVVRATDVSRGNVIALFFSARAAYGFVSGENR